MIVPSAGMVFVEALVVLFQSLMKPRVGIGIVRQPEFMG